MEIKPQAAVIPKDTAQFEQGKYGPVFPKTAGVLRVHDRRQGEARPRRRDA
ncbi:hypothetical protein ACFQ51_52050 [Streptomyces kaempferi]